MKSISEIKENINGSLSSIYTKEDVLKIVNTIESFGGGTGKTNKEFLERVLMELESIKSNIEDLSVDNDSINFSVEYREIVIDNDVEIDGKDELESEISSLIELIEEEKDREEEEEEEEEEN